MNMKENLMTDKDKITKRDLITIAIFSLLYSILIRVPVLVSVLSVALYPFIAAVGLLVCGIVWVCITAKAPKRFCILIHCCVISLWEHEGEAKTWKIA
jgi:hypothetical protein